MDAARRLARAVATMAWLMLGAFVVLGVLALSGLVSGWDSVLAAWNAAAGPWNAICRTPAARTAHARIRTRAAIERSGKKRIASSVPIQTRLRRHGANAAAAKRPSALRTPMPNAAAQMKSA